MRCIFLIMGVFFFMKAFPVISRRDCARLLYLTHWRATCNCFGTGSSIQTWTQVLVLAKREQEKEKPDAEREVTEVVIETNR